MGRTLKRKYTKSACNYIFIIFSCQRMIRPKTIAFIFYYLHYKCPTNSGFVNEHKFKCYLGIHQLYMLITRCFFFRVVKLLASSRHNSMLISYESSHFVSYNYMYNVMETNCDDVMLGCYHNHRTMYNAVQRAMIV